MCQGPFVPVVQMVDVKRKTIYQLLAGNQESRQKLTKKDLPNNVYYTVKSDGLDIRVKETRPPNFDATKKYAVLFDVYGGPNTQKVILFYFYFRWGYFACLFSLSLVWSFDFIIFFIENQNSLFLCFIKITHNFKPNLMIYIQPSST